MEDKLQQRERKSVKKIKFPKWKSLKTQRDFFFKKSKVNLQQKCMCEVKASGRNKQTETKDERETFNLININLFVKRM